MIHKVTIKNFKIFQNFECSLTEGIPLIAGPNNSGKSSFLQAIALWFEIWDYIHKNNSLAGNSIEMDKSVLRSIPISSFQELWYNCVTQNPIDIQIDLGNGKFGFEIRFISSKIIEVGLIDDTIKSINLLKGQPIKAYYIPAISSLDINEPSYKFPVIETRIARGRGGEIIRNLISRISQDDKKWQLLQYTMNDFFGYELAIPSGDDPIYSNYRHSSKENLHNLINGASGFLQVVFLTSALLNSDKKAVFLIDEPDAHLHILLKEKIYRLILDHCSETNSQAILASHSSKLIEKAGKENNLLLISGNSLTKVNTKTARDLSTIPTLQIFHAETTRRVLYIEGKTDLDILMGWATALNHPSRKILDRVFWVPTAEKSMPAIGHFKALKGKVPNLQGLVIQDKDNKEHKKVLKKPDGMDITVWNRYEIENYLIHPDSISRFTRKEFGNQKSQKVKMQIKESLPRALINNPFTEKIKFHMDSKGKRVIGEIFELSGINLSENQYYRIAEVMKEDEIHQDVKDILDLIEDCLSPPQ